MNEEAKKLIDLLALGDPEVENRIEQGIESNRKGFGQIKLLGADGKELEGAKITLKLKKHEFQFGCNSFMLDQFPEKEQNEQYRETFASLFNLAVVPFYWSDLEPEDGKLRFAKETCEIYRRPQPDLVLEYCEEKNITPKGHPLLWHHFHPEWAPDDELELKKRIHRHFQEIAERYADRIKTWDVCNEAQTMMSNPRFNFPEDHVELAFDLAARYFPNCVKTYNDDRMWYHFSKTYSPVYLLVKSLLERGYAVDALGLQYHMFDSQLQYADKYMNPHALFQCLDLYGRLGLPINISEISIISRRNLGDGDEFQRIIAERLYRMCFSHASLNGLVWWNLVDGTAAYAPIGTEEGENSLRAGLVNFDFSHKPAFTALQNLIKKEWQTETAIDYAKGAINKFNGFYGDYEAVVETDQGKSTHELTLNSTLSNNLELTV